MTISEFKQHSTKFDAAKLEQAQTKFNVAKGIYPTLKDAPSIRAYNAKLCTELMDAGVFNYMLIDQDLVSIIQTANNLKTELERKQVK